MAKVKVDKQLFWDSATGETKMGHRDPTTSAIVFGDADEVEVLSPPAVEAVEPERVEVEVDDPRFEAIPASDEGAKE